MPWFALLDCGDVGEEEVEGLEQQHSQLLHRDIFWLGVYADHSLIGASDQKSIACAEPQSRRC